MAIKAGLVGLPNVGKSTLFNALTRSQVPAENYPFCTIDPHIAITPVPDERLDFLAKVYGSKKIIPATVSFVDIAGLVQGAASGAGLGNQFLSHISEVDLIIHVVRCFEDPDIILADRTAVDPVADYEIIISELMLKDIDTISKRIPKVEHSIKSLRNDPVKLKEAQEELLFLRQLYTALEKGDSTKIQDMMRIAPPLGISPLSGKNFLIVANISESMLETYHTNHHYLSLVNRFGKERVIAISAKIEYELTKLADADAQEMMSLMSMTRSGLVQIVQRTYDALGLITFFTCGPQEAHAWPIKKNTLVRKAAGEIHSDLERGFICAELFNYTDIVATGSEQSVKETGRLRTEGADYVVQDGDILHVRFNV